jgi:creatinine amidohydrolase
MELRWDRLTWQDFGKLQKGGVDCAILPIGTIEAHGVIPLGTDCIIPETIANRIAPQLKAIIAPTINYGITHSLLGYAGSLTVSSGVFKAYVLDIMASIASKGIKKLIVINGHGGQMDEIREAAFEVFEKTGLKVAVLHWWMLCDDLVPQFYNTEGGHAAVDETAAIIACAPETVKKDYYNPKMLFPVSTGAAIYPNPSTILIYKDNTGALDFDSEKANRYFDAVCLRIRQIIDDTLSRWDSQI